MIEGLSKINEVINIKLEYDLSEEGRNLHKPQNIQPNIQYKNIHIHL